MLVTATTRRFAILTDADNAGKVACAQELKSVLGGNEVVPLMFPGI